MTAADTDDEADADAEPSEDPRAHLQDVEDGCGCAEVWETLSAARED